MKRRAFFSAVAIATMAPSSIDGVAHADTPAKPHHYFLERYSQQQPPYTLREEQITFLDENLGEGKAIYLWDSKGVLGTFRENIIKGIATGSPLGDMAQLIFATNILPHDIRHQLSSDYGISLEDIDEAAGVRGLTIIVDGVPYNELTQKGLDFFEKKGIIPKIDERWAEFSEKYAEAFHQRRIDSPTGKEAIPLEDMENAVYIEQGGNLLRINDVARFDERLIHFPGESPVIRGNFADALYTYINQRLFLDRPPGTKLVAYADSPIGINRIAARPKG